MSCQHLEFDKGHCLVEVESASPGAFTARVSLLEEDGSIVRPIVSTDGKRVEISADNESTAVSRAISYLADRFGRQQGREQACSLGAATIGRPFRLAH
jgi:hypothetical protein